MLTIRLQRVGVTKRPSYRLIISEKARDPFDKYLENLGTYHPQAKDNQFQPKADRIKYWIGQGAGVSPTVYNLLVKAGIVVGQKKRSVFLSKKRAGKIAAQKGEAEKSAAAATPAA